PADGFGDGAGSGSRSARGFWTGVSGTFPAGGRRELSNFHERPRRRVAGAEARGSDAGAPILRSEARQAPSPRWPLVMTSLGPREPPRRGIRSVAQSGEARIR